MDPLDELRTRYRQLKSRHRAQLESHRAGWSQALLQQACAVLQGAGFEVRMLDATVTATRSARVVVLRADGEDEGRIGEFLGFGFADSQGNGHRHRITAHLVPSTLPAHAPIDVNTAESIQAQIAYMEALLAEGARALAGFEIRQTMTIESYREPPSVRERLLFASLEEAIAYLLTGSTATSTD